MPAAPIACHERKDGTHMQKINPFLWFDDNAEEAANFCIFDFR